MKKKNPDICSFFFSLFKYIYLWKFLLCEFFCYKFYNIKTCKKRVTKRGNPFKTFCFFSCFLFCSANFKILISTLFGHLNRDAYKLIISQNGNLIPKELPIFLNKV